MQLIRVSFRTCFTSVLLKSQASFYTRDNLGMTEPLYRPGSCRAAGSDIWTRASTKGPGISGRMKPWRSWFRDTASNGLSWRRRSATGLPSSAEQGSWLLHFRSSFFKDLMAYRPSCCTPTLLTLHGGPGLGNEHILTSMRLGRRPGAGNFLCGSRSNGCLGLAKSLGSLESAMIGLFIRRTWS